MTYTQMLATATGFGFLGGFVVGLLTGILTWFSLWLGY